MKTKQKWSGHLAWAAGVMMAGLTWSPGLRALAQAVPTPPERLTYQGYLAGSDGVALGNSAPRNYGVIFRIFDSEAGTTPLWGERQTVTVDKGNYSVLLGEGVAVPGVPFAGITLSSLFTGPTASDRFLGLTVQGIGSGGTDVEILPRLRLQPAPYAFLSSAAVKLVQTTGADLVTSSGSQVTVSGDLKASSLNATDATLTGTLYPMNVRANTLVVTNITSVSTVQAGNVTANGTLSTPDLKAGSVTVTNSFSAGNLAASSTLTLKGKNAVVGWDPGSRIIYGNTDTHALGATLNGATLTKVSAGIYNIVFVTPFTSNPSVFLTAHGYGGYNMSVRFIGAGATYNAPRQAGATITGVQVVIWGDAISLLAPNGFPLDPGFDWVVIGK